MSANSRKDLLSSKTFWGAVVTLVAVLFPAVVPLGEVGTIVDKLVSVAGLAGVVYGRFAAGGIRSVFGIWLRDE